MQLSEQVKKMNRFNNENITLVNVSRAQARRLEQEKEALQNQVQISKPEVSVYMWRRCDSSRPGHFSLLRVAWERGYIFSLAIR